MDTRETIVQAIKDEEPTCICNNQLNEGKEFYEEEGRQVKGWTTGHNITINLTRMDDIRQGRLRYNEHSKRGLF